MRTSLRCSGVVLFFLICLPLELLAQHPASNTPMLLRHSMPFVQVVINGKGPFTFGIGTGASGEALVSPALIQQLELPIAGEADVGDPSGVNRHRVPVARIESLKVAGIEFKNVEAVQYEPAPVPEGNTDGILGFVLFRDYLLTLDYPHQQVSLASGALPHANGNEVMAFRMPDNVPVIELRIGFQKIYATLDSRGMSLSLPEKFARGLQFACDPVVIGRGRTVSNEFEIKGAEFASDIQLGGYTFSKPFVEVNPVFPIANFGSVGLRHFSVTFDQKNKLVRFFSTHKNITISAPRMIRSVQPGSQPRVASVP